MSATDVAVCMMLLPTFGPRADGMSIGGVLKLARGSELAVTRSTITFFDVSGAVVGELHDAFALTVGARFTGASSKVLHDGRSRPSAAATMSWTLDVRETPPVPVIDARPDAGELTLWCAPLHVPVRDDHQLFVQYVNLAAHAVDLSAAVRGATLWVDGIGHRSTTGFHWDGRSRVHANGWTQQGFRMSDFDGAPLLGTHEIAIEMFGQRTLTQAVLLEGEPWLPHT